MHPFIETISIAGAVAITVVGVIIVLTLFYRGLSWMLGAGSDLKTFAVRGALKKDASVTVHLAGGSKLENVRFHGFLSSGPSKGYVPFELNGMVILEDQQKQRYFIRAKNIQMIVVAPDAHAE